MPPGSFMAPEWIDFVREEYFHCRESVSLIDMSSYAKFEIKVRRIIVLPYSLFISSRIMNHIFSSSVCWTGSFRFLAEPVLQQHRRSSWNHCSNRNAKRKRRIWKRLHYSATSREQVCSSQLCLTTSKLLNMYLFLVFVDSSWCLRQPRKQESSIGCKTTCRWMDPSPSRM